MNIRTVLFLVCTLIMVNVMADEGKKHKIRAQSITVDHKKLCKKYPSHPPCKAEEAKKVKAQEFDE